MKIYNGLTMGKYSVRFYGDDRTNYINQGNTKQDCYNAVVRNFTKALKSLKNEKSLTIYYGEWSTEQRERENNCVVIWREDEYDNFNYGKDSDNVRTVIYVKGVKDGKTVRIIEKKGKWRKNKNVD